MHVVDIMRQLKNKYVYSLLTVLLTAVMLFSCGDHTENGESEKIPISSSLYPLENIQKAEEAVPLFAEFEEDEWSRTELCLPKFEVPVIEKGERYVYTIWAIQKAYAVCGVYRVKPQASDDAYMTLVGLYCYSTEDGTVVNEISVGDEWGINQILFDQKDVFVLLVGKQGIGDVPYQWSRQTIGSEESVILKEATAPWNRPPQMEKFHNELLLFDYDPNKKQVVGYRPDQTVAAALSLGQKLPVDLEVSANAGHLALLVTDGKKAQFQVYDAKADLTVSRELREDEKVYSWHLLSDGLLIYMQDLANGRFDEYKMIWMSLSGGEKEYKEKAQLWNGLDNGTNQVVFVELDSKVDGSMTIHVYKAEGCGLSETRYSMPYSLSKLPAYTHLEENQVYFFTENQEKLFRLEKILN